MGEIEIIHLFTLNGFEYKIDKQGNPNEDGILWFEYKDIIVHVFIKKPHQVFIYPVDLKQVDMDYLENNPAGIIESIKALSVLI